MEALNDQLALCVVGVVIAVCLVLVILLVVGFIVNSIFGKRCRFIRKNDGKIIVHVDITKIRDTDWLN